MQNFDKPASTKNNNIITTIEIAAVNKNKEQSPLEKIKDSLKKVKNKLLRKPEASNGGEKISPVDIKSAKPSYKDAGVSTESKDRAASEEKFTLYPTTALGYIAENGINSIYAKKDAEGAFDMKMSTDYFNFLLDGRLEKHNNKELVIDAALRLEADKCPTSNSELQPGTLAHTDKNGVNWYCLLVSKADVALIATTEGEVMRVNKINLLKINNIKQEDEIKNKAGKDLDPKDEKPVELEIPELPKVVNVKEEVLSDEQEAKIDPKKEIGNKEYVDNVNPIEILEKLGFKSEDISQSFKKLFDFNNENNVRTQEQLNYQIGKETRRIINELLEKESSLSGETEGADVLTDFNVDKFLQKYPNLNILFTNATSFLFLGKDTAGLKIQENYIKLLEKETKSKKDKEIYTLKFTDTFKKFKLELNSETLSKAVEKRSELSEEEADKELFSILAQEMVSQYETFKKESANKYEVDFLEKAKAKLKAETMAKTEEFKLNLKNEVEQQNGFKFDDAKWNTLVEKHRGLKNKIGDFEVSAYYDEEEKIGQIKAPPYYEIEEFEFESYIQHLGVENEMITRNLKDLILGDINSDANSETNILIKHHKKDYIKSLADLLKAETTEPPELIKPATVELVSAIESINSSDAALLAKSFLDKIGYSLDTDGEINLEADSVNIILNNPGNNIDEIALEAASQRFMKAFVEYLEAEGVTAENTILAAEQFIEQRMDIGNATNALSLKSVLANSVTYSDKQYSIDTTKGLVDFLKNYNPVSPVKVEVIVDNEDNKNSENPVVESITKYATDLADKIGFTLEKSEIIELGVLAKKMDDGLSNEEVEKQMSQKLANIILLDWSKYCNDNRMMLLNRNITVKEYVKKVTNFKGDEAQNIIELLIKSIKLKPEDGQWGIIDSSQLTDFLYSLNSETSSLSDNTDDGKNKEANEKLLAEYNSLALRMGYIPKYKDDQILEKLSNVSGQNITTSLESVLAQDIIYNLRNYIPPIKKLQRFAINGLELSDSVKLNRALDEFCTAKFTSAYARNKINSALQELAMLIKDEKDVSRHVFSLISVIEHT